MSIVDEVFNTPPSRLRRWLPWLPRAYRIKRIRLFIFLLRDCSYYARRRNSWLDVLRENDGRARIVGFQVWYC